MLPAALARDLAARSDRVAAMLAVGDRCGADEQADKLLEEVVSAVNDRDVPPALAEELASAANTLTQRIECPAEPTPPPPPPPSTEQDTTGDDEEEPAETEDDEGEEEPPPPPPPPPPPEEPPETVPTETETVPTDTGGETTTTTGTTTQEAP